MKIRRIASALLALTLWAAGTAFAEAEIDYFPVGPAQWDETCISQEEAIAVAKDAMEQRGTPYVEEEGNVKAGFVELESGERAWVVMLDSAYHADALLTVSPAGEVTGYQGTSQEKLEIYTIVLEAWRAEKGAQQLWSIEEKALFRWLYGSDNAYVAPTENDIPQEQAVEIALAALPEELSELTYSVTFDNYYKDASVRVWRFNVFGQGTEAYVIYVDAGDGEVLEIFPVSNFG